MTAKVVYPLRQVVAVMLKAQLMCEGHNPVKVQFALKDGTMREKLVQSARFDENSGNVVLVLEE